MRPKDQYLNGYIQRLDIARLVAAFVLAIGKYTLVKALLNPLPLD